MRLATEQGFAWLLATGIIFRGAAYAFRAGASTGRELARIDTTFSVSSILTPFALGAAVGGIGARGASRRPAGR